MKPEDKDWKTAVCVAITGIVLGIILIGFGIGLLVYLINHLH